MSHILLVVLKEGLNAFCVGRYAHLAVGHLAPYIDQSGIMGANWAQAQHA